MDDISTYYIENSIPPAIVCIIEASRKYDVPADIMLAIAEMEGGTPHQANKNKNGTYDYGLMQFNTVYLEELKQYGITKNDVMQDNCYPYELATWRIKNHLVKDKGSVWKKAANYHSRTETHNKRYRDLLQRKAANWALWLSKFFKISN